MKKFLQKTFYYDNWFIGIINQKINDIRHDDYEVNWLKYSSLNRYYADPFGISINNKDYILAEEFCHYLKRGRLVIFELKNYKLINKKILLDDKKHLSYPFIFNENNKNYIICESYKSNQLNLYELDSESLKLNKIKTIFKDIGGIDPTIIKYQNYYWLFYSKKIKPEEDLYLAYSDSLLNEFIQHPQNPIKSCKATSRCGGTPFVIDDKIYRIAQNCLENYGHKITINQITNLNTKNHSEEKSYEILPPKNSSKVCRRVHTLAAFGDKTLIDGYNIKFAAHKPLISLVRNLTNTFRFHKKKRVKN